MRLQTQLIRQEREMEQVAGTHNDGVKALAGAISKMRHISFKMRHQWHFFDALRPLIAKWLAAITDGY